MIIAMLIIPLVDGIAKYLSQDYSPLFVSWMRYLSGTLFVVPITLAIHGKRAWPTQGVGSQVARTIFLVLAMTLYFVAISTVPLADATAAYLLAPVITSVLAVLILNEAFSRRKALAVILGLVGAMTIVRPGFSTEPGILLALGAGVSFALYVIATRKASQASEPLVTLNFQYVLGALLLTPLGMLYFSVPLTDTLLLVVLMGAISVTAHLLSIIAFKFAQASTLAPLIYLELVSSVAVGYWLFGDLPTTLTWVGIVIIVVSGLLLIQSSDEVDSTNAR
jgi:drug/metabolite transporter (DMT)-like permease